ncbi:MAG: T9SS type A sorting domain-containing protein [Flavobacteriales bacterium]|nr:T9SS type A sorting domain-containing protein [Flavobacteriales bacterium]
MSITLQATDGWDRDHLYLRVILTHHLQRMSQRSLFLYLSALFVQGTMGQANCGQTSTGMVPINDLGTGTYMGMMGGLYPNGLNVRPPAHHAAGLAFAAQVQPLDTTGAPDPVNGKVVWLSIGFSNATQETQTFIPMATALPDLNPKLVLVDGALGGQTAAILSTPTNPSYATYWNTVINRLSAAGVTDQQVQAIWLKDDNQATLPIEEHSDSVHVQFKRITHELHDRFPNAHLCYIASRIYAGYASSALNPEPYAYRNGWTMKQLIGEQIAGDPELQHSGAGANAPWLSWGVYLWADGTTPRSDGLTWVCPDDYQNDGTHPSTIGRAKVAALLLDFFTTDSTTCSWFLNDCGISTGVAEVEGPSLSVFPNPAISTMTISGLPPGASVIAVYDGSGRRVLGASLNTAGHVIDVAALSSGVYQLVVYGERIRTARFVIAQR